MTNPHLEHDIMNRVIRFEQRRLRRWRLAFFAALILAGAIVILSVISAAVILEQRESLLVLDIFRQDWTIIQQGWWDALRSIWTDIPRRYVTTVIATVVTGLVIIFSTRRQRQVQRRQRQSIKDIRTKSPE